MFAFVYVTLNFLSYIYRWKTGTGEDLPWSLSVSTEEVEAYKIGVLSISLGVDRVTVRLIKVYWELDFRKA